MDWIHCNGCFAQPRTNSNPPKFFLTSCGHIFCERCNESANPNKCGVCEAEYTTTVLSSELREEVRDFFADPDTLYNKATKVTQYQNSHRARLFSYLRRLQPKYEAAKREIQKYHEENKTLRKKLHVAQQEIAWYKMQRDRQRAARAAAASSAAMPSPAPSSSLPSCSPFMSSTNTQRAALQQMRNSGMGNSRISMGFTTGCTPNLASRNGRDNSPLPSSLLEGVTPFNIGPYRNRNFATPESTPGGVSSFVPPGSLLTPASGFGHGPSQQIRRQHSPPSRGTPTEALKILSLAYKNNHT